MMFITVEPPASTSFNSKVEKIEYATSVIKSENAPVLDTSAFITMVKLSMTSPATAVKNRISEIDHLSDNWDGFGGIAPESLVIKNSFKFLDLLLNTGIDCIDSDDIYPTPYGSIVIELNSSHGLLSIEIGRQSVGFFTDFTKHENISSEGERTDFRSIPDNLLEALSILSYGA